MYKLLSELCKTNNICCRVQKKSQESINARLALVMKSGKFTLGSKTCLKTLRSGKGVYDIFSWLVSRCISVGRLLLIIGLILSVLHSQADSDQQQLPSYQEDRD